VIRANRPEAQGIAERKKTLAAMLANVAELGAERMEETIGKAGLRDAAIGTGVAMDKMLALTGQTPAFQIANIVMSLEAKREERRAIQQAAGRDCAASGGCTGTARGPIALHGHQELAANKNRQPIRAAVEPILQRKFLFSEFTRRTSIRSEMIRVSRSFAPRGNRESARAFAPARFALWIQTGAVTRIIPFDETDRKL